LIHPAALVDPRARLAADVEVGPWTTVGPDVEIGAGCVIGPHVVIKGPTSIGRANRIHAFCSIGEDPQDKKFVPGSDSALRIGDGNTFREYCSINRGTANGGGVTRIGDDNWFMAYCHVAHDCHIGNHTVFANHATLAGHVEVGDFAILGGFTGVHQFCRVGESAFTAIAAAVVRDVPPYVMVDGNTAVPRCINREGLKRRGFTPETIAALKRCYRALYRQGLPLDAALEVLAGEGRDCPEALTMLEFIRRTTRGIVR